MSGDEYQMYCNKCGKEVPDDANVCPYCSTPIKNGTHKNAKSKKKGCMIGCLGIIVIFVIIGIIGAIAGHNSSNNTATQQQKRAYKINETFKSDAFEMTITGKDIVKRVNDSSGLLYSEANGVFVVVHVHYKNIANQSRSLDSGAFQLTADGKQYSPTILTVNINENIFHNTINPGIEKDGNVYFDVPEDVAKSNLDLKMSSTFTSDTFNGDVQLY